MGRGGDKGVLMRSEIRRRKTQMKHSPCLNIHKRKFIKKTSEAITFLMFSIIISCVLHISLVSISSRNGLKTVSVKVFVEPSADHLDHEASISLPGSI